MYKKSILLTQDKRLEQSIKMLMRTKKKEIETELLLLSDIHAIKNDIHQNNNTINIRGEFGYFVKKYGFPFMLILDYQIDFNLSIDNDPDKRKLVRTFLLAFTLLANGKGFENATANIVFIIDKNQHSKASQFARYPVFLLEQIRTRDERLNAIIESFAKNDEKVKKFFKISYIFKPEDGKYAQEIERLEKIIDVYDKIVVSMVEPVVKKTGTEMISEELAPADVICRATVDRLIINGKATQITEEGKTKYLEKNIHILGAVTQRTIPTVKDRIVSIFNTMAKIKPFKKDERIFINIPDTSVIDGSFAISIGTFLSKELSEYTGISCNIGKSNCDKLKNSHGYFAIEDFIIKNL